MVGHPVKQLLLTAAERRDAGKPEADHAKEDDALKHIRR
jgi:hypothetical protein